MTAVHAQALSAYPIPIFLVRGSTTAATEHSGLNRRSASPQYRKTCYLLS